MKNIVIKSSVKILLAFGLVLPLVSCGGGGGSGDGDFFGAGTVKIVASPRTIDTGDRTKLVITIDEVHPDGIILKLKFPEALEYVLNSSVLKVGEKDKDIGPAFNGRDGDSSVFLVYFINNAAFDKLGMGILSLELEGISDVKDGEIGVDIDVDDPLIDNGSEFNVRAPEFLAEASASINVQG